MRIALAGNLHYGAMRSVLPGLGAALRRSHEVVLISPSPGPEDLGPLRVRAVGFRPRWLYPFDVLSQALRIPRALRAERIEFVHLHVCRLGHYWLWGLLLRALKVPYGVTYHVYTTERTAPLLRRFRAFSAWAYWCVETFLLPRAAFVTAVSEDLRSFVAARLRADHSIRVVPNGVPDELLAAETPPDMPGEPYILAFASSAPGKGADWLFLAFRDLLESGHRVKLRICGSGMDNLRPLARLLGLEKHVVLQEFVRHSEAMAQMRNALFYVQASRLETFSLSALEALACGKAVIASRVGGMLDFLVDGDNAALVPALDAPALARAMARLIDEPALRKRLEGNARATARRFAWSAVARLYEELYAADV